jgi:transposase
VKKIFNGGAVCHDVASISSYAQEMPEVERGYNRDGDNLRQFNLGMFCDETTKTPLYFSRYNGSITDKANLSLALASAADLGVKRVKMILDGGFWSEDCIKSLKARCNAFAIGMPAFLKESEKLLASNSNSIETYTNELSCRHVYCMQADIEIYGVAGRALIFCDSLNHLKLCEEMTNRIDSLKSELAALKCYPKSKLKRCTPYFTISKHEHGKGLDYAVDIEKAGKLRKWKGFFPLFSTDMESAPSDLLYFYRAKDADEKLFAQIKAGMDGGGIRTHNEETAEGKTLAAFIACAIRSYMLGKLSSFLPENSTSMKKALN